MKIKKQNYRCYLYKKNDVRETFEINVYISEMSITHVLNIFR